MSINQGYRRTGTWTLPYPEECVLSTMIFTVLEWMPCSLLSQKNLPQFIPMQNGKTLEILPSFVGQEDSFPASFYIIGLGHWCRNYYSENRTHWRWGWGVKGRGVLILTYACLQKKQRLIELIKSVFFCARKWKKNSYSTMKKLVEGPKQRQIIEMVQDQLELMWPLLSLINSSGTKDRTVPLNAAL